MNNLDPMVQAICNALQPFPREQHEQALETVRQLYAEANQLFAALSHEGNPPVIQALGAA